MRTSQLDVILLHAVFFSGVLLIQQVLPAAFLSQIQPITSICCPVPHPVIRHLLISNLLPPATPLCAVCYCSLIELYEMWEH